MSNASAGGCRVNVSMEYQPPSHYKHHISDCKQNIEYVKCKRHMSANSHTSLEIVCGYNKVNKKGTCPVCPPIHKKWFVLTDIFVNPA